MRVQVTGVGRAVALALVCFSAVSAQTPWISVQTLDWDPTVPGGSFNYRLENAPPPSSALGLVLVPSLLGYAFIPDSGWVPINNCYASPLFGMTTPTYRATKFHLRMVWGAGFHGCGDYGESLPPSTLPSPVELTISRGPLYKKTLRFSGFDWSVKDSIGYPVGPGPNAFCESGSSVDGSGKLHLKIASGCSSEVILKKSLGYGTYRFKVETPLSAMHPNAVLGMFTWSEEAASAHREIDIELSQWRGTVPTNAQFVVQPYTVPTQMQRFNVSTATSDNVFQFDWAPGRVRFEGPSNTFTVAGTAVPMSDDERVRLNLYWDQGASGGVTQEMVISSFEFIPTTTTGLDPSAISNLIQVSAAGINLPTLRVDQPGAWAFTGLPSQLRALPSSGNGPGFVDFNVQPNWSSSWRVHRGSVGSRAFEIQQAPAVGTVEQRTIGMLYTNLLGRVPANEERDFQLVKALHQGTTVADLATNFFSTPEFQDTGRFAAGLYRGLLCRDPEYTGWLLQRSVLSSGQVSQRQLVANFFGTPEAGLLYGGVSKEQFIRTIYSCALGRVPADAEVQAQAQLLDVSLNRVDFVYNILKSQEFQLGSNRRITAFLLYAALLNRDASALEISWWTDQLKVVPLRQAVSTFVNSEEFAIGLR